MAPTITRASKGSVKPSRRLLGLPSRRVTRSAPAHCVLSLKRYSGKPTGAREVDRDGKVVNIWTLEILDGQIQTIRTVINPDKLGQVGPVADAWAVVRETTQALRSADQSPEGR